MSIQNELLKQIKNSQNMRTGMRNPETIFKQFEHLIVHDNLYLVSEAVKISLFELMPYLIECSHKNQLVSVLVTNELIKILYDILCHLENLRSDKCEI